MYLRELPPLSHDPPFAAIDGNNKLEPLRHQVPDARTDESAIERDLGHKALSPSIVRGLFEIIVEAERQFYEIDSR